MMKSLLYDKITKFSLPKAVILSTMGIVVLVFPDALFGGMFPYIVGYMLLNGALILTDYFVDFDLRGTLIGRVTVAAAVIMILFSVFSITYWRYLIHTVPLYLGALLIAEGAACFAAALACRSKIRTLLKAFSLIVTAGSITVFIFTFGFGIGGISGLTKVMASTLILSGICWLTTRLSRYR